MATASVQTPPQTLPQNPIVLIPSRLASTRLPDKPLADIHGLPMIVHCLQRAREAGFGRVAVACGDAAIAEAVRAAGGEAVMTDPGHPSGSDRIFEALGKLDPDGRHDAVINLQGDLPAIDPKIVAAALTPLADPAVAIATLATPIVDAHEIDDPNVVKAVLSLRPGETVGRALYFSRRPVPSGEGRCGTISASTPIAARRCSASSACRRRRWNSAKSWNSCGRWRTAWSLPRLSLTPCRSVSILRPILSASAM